MASPVKLTEEEITARNVLIFEWVAHYKDGTVLKQYDDEKQLVYHFGLIDQEQISSFEIVPKKEGLFSIRIDLEKGLFYIDDKLITELFMGETRVALGLSGFDGVITSTWGNKAKPFFWRHMRRDFVQGDYGFEMKVSVIYEIGWEGDVEGEHKKFSLIVNEDGSLGVPKTFEDEGFKLL